MGRIVAVLGLHLAGLLSLSAYAQSATDSREPEKPRVYAIIAAVGEQFTVMFKVSKVAMGTNIAPNYSRKSVAVKDNILNRYVLHSVDAAIARADPDSKRIFMTLRAKDMDAGSASERESVALDEIITDLKGMPEREEWDRIVLVTPAYKAFEYNGVGGRLAGFGVFYNPLGGRIYDGEDSETPDGKFIRSWKYTAPFSLIDIWVLDPKTLKVLDKQQRYDNVKVFDPLSDDLYISGNVSPKILFDKFSRLVDRSVAAAVDRSAILTRRGVINVGDVKEVKPDNGK